MTENEALVALEVAHRAKVQSWPCLPHLSRRVTLMFLSLMDMSKSLEEDDVINSVWVMVLLLGDHVGLAALLSYLSILTVGVAGIALMRGSRHW